ncbi:MAG TPA: serine/threonine protein kinase, partial [Deinococcales bacterium]|nr:serine/threonine protein kinase [Deinococcales bacterium]
MALLDGKYSVVREVSSADGLTVYETHLPGGETARVDWFTVNDPKTRSLFHQYRTALKVIGSPLLIDAVIRPGVYYSAWWPSEAPAAGGYLADHPRDQKVRERLEEMAETLAAYGFALRD